MYTIRPSQAGIEEILEEQSEDASNEKRPLVVPGAVMSAWSPFGRLHASAIADAQS